VAHVLGQHFLDGLKLPALDALTPSVTGTQVQLQSPEVALTFEVCIITEDLSGEGNGPKDFAMLWLFTTPDMVDSMSGKAKIDAQLRTGWDGRGFTHADHQLLSSPFTCCQFQLELDCFSEGLHCDFNL
jgi:hypothetical protein